MKTTNYILLATWTALTVFQQSEIKVNNFRQNFDSIIVEATDTTTKNCSCLDQKDAEKILGKAAILTENSTEKKNGITKFRCTFTSDIIDNKTTQKSNLYYLLENFENIESSIKVYSDLISQNADLSGFKKVSDIGNEAFFHTDKNNFLFIMIRKENKILRLKVNKLTSLTSVNELNQIAKKITLTL